MATGHESVLGGPVAIVLDTTEFGGAEVYASVLVETLRGRAEFVAIVGDGAAEETRARLADAGAEVRVVPGLRRRPSLAALIRLARTIRLVDPALVHFNLTDQGDGLASLAARSSRRPMMATLHLVVPNRRRWREWVSGRILRRFPVLIGVSHAVARYLVQHGIYAVVVKNGLPPASPVSDPRRQLGLPGDAFVVGGIGRLHEQKGWDVLCRAAPLVRGARPDSVFAVIGDGPEADRLKAVPGSSDVRFLGYRSHGGSLVGAFDVLAVPSRYEGLGLTPLEAMFQGVPVVASRIPGLSEVLGDSALLIPPDDPEALAGAILRLASTPELRASLAERGRRRANELFTAERMAEETLALYRSLGSIRSSEVGALVPAAGKTSEPGTSA